MSAFVFSGAAQMVAMEIWSNPITIGTILTLAASTFVIGLRMVLMGMSLRPWLGDLPPAQIYPPLLLNTDSTWMIALRYREEGGNDPSVLLGGGLSLWVMWLAIDHRGLCDRKPDREPAALRSRPDPADLLCRDAGAALARSARRDPLGDRGRDRARSCNISFRVTGTSSSARSPEPSAEASSMSENDVLPYATFIAIATMAAMTYLVRVGGFWMMGHVPITARVHRMLEALPGSVVAAIILPVVAKNGLPALFAVLAVIAVMTIRRNDFIAIGAGLAVAALARFAGL